MSINVNVCECTIAETRGLRSPGTVVTDTCVPSNMDTGSQTAQPSLQPANGGVLESGHLSVFLEVPEPHLTTSFSTDLH